MKHTGLNYNNGDFHKVGAHLGVAGLLLGPPDAERDEPWRGERRPKRMSKTLSRRQTQYRTRRTCADGVQGESAGEERVCDFLLLPVEDEVLPDERQGIDCGDPGP